MMITSTKQQQQSPSSTLNHLGWMNSFLNQSVNPDNVFITAVNILVIAEFPIRGHSDVMRYTCDMKSNKFSFSHDEATLQFTLQVSRLAFGLLGATNQKNARTHRWPYGPCFLEQVWPFYEEDETSDKTDTKDDFCYSGSNATAKCSRIEILF